MKMARQAISMKPEEIEIFIDLLIAAGIPYAVADSEADHKIAKLSKGKIISGVLSEDSDLLTHGVDVLMRPSGADSVVLYDRNEILRELGLDHDQFVDLCILLGTDYNDNPTKLGPVTAFKLIQDNGCIEEIIKKNEKFDLEEIKSKFRAIREIYNECNNTENEAVRIHPFDHEKLSSYLEKRSFRKENRDKFLSRFKKLAGA